MPPCAGARGAATGSPYRRGPRKGERPGRLPATGRRRGLPRARLSAASVLTDAQLWEPAFTTAYDAFRAAADAVVLPLGYRVPATHGRAPDATCSVSIATDIAHAGLKADTDAFAPAGAERFRQGRHESEYFDPSRPVDKTAGDATWAFELASRAIDSVAAAISD